jgi:hypothetical protein
MGQRELGLHTNRANHLDRRVRGQRRLDDGVHQCGLADTWFTLDAHSASMSGHRAINRVENGAEFGITAQQHKRTVTTGLAPCTSHRSVRNTVPSPSVEMSPRARCLTIAIST